jgi:photosystem II stability/assembly factor-like uncharacterized protein
MKKLLLITCLLSTIYTQAQDYWTEYATSQPEANTGMTSISIVDDNVTWLNMSCGTPACTPIRRYSKTIDGGMYWQTAAIDLGSNSANLKIGNISAVSDMVAYAAVHPTGAGAIGGIWQTTDGGTTWARQASATFSDPASFVSLVHFWNANDGVAIGDAVDGYFEIYTTANGGNLWTRVASSPALVPIDAEEYLVTNNFTVTDNTIWAMTDHGRLLKSTDKGLSWTIAQTPILDFEIHWGMLTADMAFTDQNNGLLQTSDFQLFYTNDGGVTWTDLPYSGVIRNFGIAAIPGVPNAYVAVGEDTNLQRGSSFSIDAGLNWISINDNPDLTYVNGGVVEFQNTNNGFASGFSVNAVVGGIFKWASGCVCGAATDFYGNKSVVASPNPTSGILNIKGTNISQIIVSDMLGKQISSTSYHELNETTINLDKLVNGLYMVSVVHDKGTSKIKVVKQ